MSRKPDLTVLLLAAWAHAAPPAVVVDGSVPTPLSLTAADLAAMPRAELKVKGHDGKDATYAGVTLRSVLLKAGAPLGNHQMRGANAALFLVATASDGYKVVFALAEVDAEIAERDILLADTRDGQPLDAKEGPFRLILPHEQLQARWIRQVTTLTILSAR